MKDLGLDSLDQVEIIVQLEDAFGKFKLFVFCFYFLVINLGFFFKVMKYRIQITKN